MSSWLWFFFFLCNVLLLSQKVQKCNKHVKCWYFSLGPCLVCSTYWDSQKIDFATNDKCLQNFMTSGQHHDMSKTCLQLSQLSGNSASNQIGSQQIHRCILHAIFRDNIAWVLCQKCCWPDPNHWPWVSTQVHTQLLHSGN